MAISVSAAALFKTLAAEPYPSAYPSQVNGWRRCTGHSDVTRQLNLLFRSCLQHLRIYFVEQCLRG